MKKIFLLVLMFVLLAFNHKPIKVVIGSYSRISSFYACGKQEILLFNDSTYLYRLYYKKKFKQKMGRYRLNNNKVEFYSLKKVLRKVEFTVSELNNSFLKDSVIVFDDRDYNKSSVLGAPCIFKNDTIIFTKN